MPQPAGFGVGVGVGDAGVGVAEAAFPLTPQEVQAVPNPPPGFCHAAGALDRSVRSVQPHWPPGVKSILAWIETHLWPGDSVIGVGKKSVKTPATFV